MNIIPAPPSEARVREIVREVVREELMELGYIDPLTGARDETRAERDRLKVERDRLRGFAEEDRTERDAAIREMQRVLAEAAALTAERDQLRDRVAEQNEALIEWSKTADDLRAQVEGLTAERDRLARDVQCLDERNRVQFIQISALHDADSTLRATLAKLAGGE